MLPLCPHTFSITHVLFCSVSEAASYIGCASITIYCCGMARYITPPQVNSSVEQSCIPTRNCPVVMRHTLQLAGPCAPAAHPFACWLYLVIITWRSYKECCPADLTTLEQGPPRVPISWVSLSPFDKMEFGQDQWAEVVLPQDLPFNWETTPKLSMKEALFWKLTFQDNYGHLLGEHGPIIHNLMCSYLNRSACIA